MTRWVGSFCLGQMPGLQWLAANAGNPSLTPVLHPCPFPVPPFPRSPVPRFPRTLIYLFVRASAARLTMP